MYLPVNWGHLYTRIVSAFEMIFCTEGVFTITIDPKRAFRITSQF